MEGAEFLIEGERVALGRLRRDLPDTHARWTGSLAVWPGLSHLGILDRVTEEAGLDEALNANAQHEPTRANFTIYARDDGEPVGTSALFDVNHHHARARFGILLGERRGEGPRHGGDAADARLGLPGAQPAQRPARGAALERGRDPRSENAGFRVIGRRRDALLAHGRRWDEVHTDALASEFSGSVPADGMPSGE